MRIIVALSMLILLIAPAGADPIVADHLAVAEFEQIPTAQFDSIRSHFNFYYGHTSHGSQIMTGLGMLEDEDPLYAEPLFHETSGDLGHNGYLGWVQPTQDWLNAHPECNVVMWSWCGGCSDNTEEGINIYLAAMTQLELDYPDVLFVYMTGHLDWSGSDGELYRSNNQIRAYCLANDKTLYDFADIESYDPDGNYYPDDTDACNWCSDWCATHDCPDCGDCAHSHCFNCYLKGKGFWWMMARVDGWSPTSAPETPAPGVHLAQNHPNPFNPLTEISFNLAVTGRATLSVHDITGQRVALIHDGSLAAGEHNFSWNGQDDEHRPLASGVYLYRLITIHGEVTRKLTLLK